MSIYDDMNFNTELYTLEDVRNDLGRVVKYFQGLPYYDLAMQAFIIETRKMPESVIKDSDAFFIDEDTVITDLPEWLRNEALGIVKNNYIPQAGRCVFPVKSATKSVIGFVGWDPTTTPKYLDSHNYGYKAKVATFYGMENIAEYYASPEPVFITEGLMCTLWLRSNGFHAMASLGSSLSKYCQIILKRFGTRAVIVPDNDEAGEGYLKQVMYTLPKAQRIMVKYGKDIDGCRLEHKDELLSDLKNLITPGYKYKVILRR